MVSLDADAKMLYVNGSLDNSTELAEKFFAKVAKVTVDGEHIKVKEMTSPIATTSSLKINSYTFKIMI